MWPPPQIYRVFPSGSSAFSESSVRCGHRSARTVQIRPDSVPACRPHRTHTFSVDHLFSGYHAAPVSEIVCISANRLPADCHFRVRSKVIEVIIIGNKRILVHAAPASRIIIVIIPVYPAACRHNAVFVYIIIVSVVLKQLVISSGSIGVDPVMRSVQKQPARMACAVLIEIIRFSAVLHPAGGKCSI